MRKCLLQILLIFLCFQYSNSESSYPYTISGFTEYSGGEAVVFEHKNPDSIVVYQLNFDFTKGNESIKISGINPDKSTVGIIISNTKIICNSLLYNNLILITRETGGLFAGILHKDGKITGKIKISENQFLPDKDNCRIIKLIEGSEYLLKIENELYKIEVNDKSKMSLKFMDNIEGDLLSLDNSSGFNTVEYAIVQEINSGLVVNFYDYLNKFQFLTKIVTYGTGRWMDLGTRLVYMTSPDGIQTLVQVIDKKSGLLISTFWLNAEPHLMTFKSAAESIVAVYIETSSEGYNLCRAEIKIENPKIQPQILKLSGNMINPMYLSSYSDNYLIFFANSIIMFDESLSLSARQFYPLEKKINSINNVKIINNDIYLLSFPVSIRFSLQPNDYWLLKKIYAEFKNYFFPILLSVFLIIFVQLFRHQRRLARELLDLPNIGLLFVVDSAGRLINLNSLAKEFLEINDSIPRRKFFRFYAKNNRSQLFADLIDKGLESKESSIQKITVKIDNSETEWLCKTIPVRNITGMFRGVVLSAVDITEQLERKRLSNWAQLAHDMQTNLSTIKLNAEHLDIAVSENNSKRQRRIVYQVNLLMQRVRDIVTVGRSDVLNIETCSICDLCQDVRNEFDELMFPGIEFKMECQNFLIQCDKPKLIRAVRNAVENGIKAMKGNPGKITFKTAQDRKYATITIADTGSGMDEDTKKRMLIPYFTTASKTGGSGIGTMIMQHVTELHGGFLLVNSEKGKGTEVIFHIPNTLSNKKDKLLRNDE
ncbi:MAG: HAMP domain-containing sensor histidine kinase [Candidatus Kapabacteria bacterium]|nr:HAMP domain-containing sensor histidine kinase [Candidatus Kapabacteria bacterium]